MGKKLVPINLGKRFHEIFIVDFSSFLAFYFSPCRPINYELTAEPVTGEAGFYAKFFPSLDAPPQLPRNVARVTCNLHNATSTLRRCAPERYLYAPPYRFISRIIGLSKTAPA